LRSRGRQEFFAVVLDQLTQLIGRTSGTRLPPERRLAEELGVTRAEVRKCLAILESEGRLVRKVGRGTFVRGQETGFTADINALSRDTSPRDAMQARLLIEPELAAVAAVHATAKQIDAMRDLATRTRGSRTWEEYEVADGRFHRLIAECSGNNLLMVVHDIVNEVRRAVIGGWLDTHPTGPPADYSSFAEHDAIVAAIEKRDRVTAAEAMRRHLRTTNARLIGSED
jgi:DNA-binding FadR family transcriptional regulator